MNGSKLHIYIRTKSLKKKKSDAQNDIHEGKLPEMQHVSKMN